MWVTGSGSLANVVSFTPGAVGITQATNALALDTCCDVANSTAVDYSTAQQLITTAWNVLLALVLVVCVFGWTGGKLLVGRVLHGREGQGRRAEGAARGEEGGEAGSEGRRVTTEASPPTASGAVPGSPSGRGSSRSALLLSWAITAASLVGRRRDPARRRHRRLRRRARSSPPSSPLLNAVLPPLLAALRLPFMLALGFLLVLALERLRPEARLGPAREHLHGRQLRLGAARGARRRRGQRRPRGDLRDERRRHLHAARRAADRPAPGRRASGPTCPGSSSSRSTGSRCRCSGARCGTATRGTMARWLAEGTHALTEWETDLSSQTGASQAGILLGSNDDIPAFRWVDKESGLLTACSAPADCARIERERATGIGLLVERRLEPRQPALRRGRGGHPHGQPHGGREEGEPGLPGVLRQRLQRHARARPLRLGGHPRVDRLAARDPTRRAAARPPRRHLSVHARRDVRDRPRPDRLRRAHGHDARPPCRVRDVLELRRGRAPLGSRARGHARGAAQARRAVRPHRPRPPLRPTPVQDRRALRPRADAGRDLQAAQRLRARRARRALARARHRGEDRRRRRAAVDGRPRRRRGDRPSGRAAGQALEERRLRPRTSSCSAPGTSASSR